MAPPKQIRFVPAVSNHPRDTAGHDIEPIDASSRNIPTYDGSTRASNTRQTDDPSSEDLLPPYSHIPVASLVPQPPPPLSPASQKLQQAIKTAFQAWHGKTARPWQVDACQQVMMRTVHRLPSSPLRPILLVRSTGGGKSAVRDVCGFLSGGITITIVPLLSLAADQTSKLVALSATQGLKRRLKVYNLDVIRSPPINELLRRNLESLPRESKVTVSLFSSPQKLTRDPSWQQTLVTCFRRGLMRFISVDECHLYASHGREFREEFGDLRAILFQMAKRHASVPTPILFMTATASSEMLSDLESLTGLQFDKDDDLMWPHQHSGVHRRNVFIDITFQDTPIRKIKRELIKTSRSPNGRKLMVHSNSRKAIINLYEKCRHELNIRRVDKDLVLVHGNMYREQKFHNTDLFVGKPLMEDCPTTRRTLRFDPVAFFATAGATSSGIDCPEVDQVLFHGFPQTNEDLLQCSGRCGRSPDATYNTSRFTIIASLNSMVSLLTRIFIIPKYEAAKASARQNKTNNAQPETERSNDRATTSQSALLSQSALAQRQWERARNVLSLICIDDGRCVHFAMEQLLMHPNKESICDLPPSCGGACWQCANPRISNPLDAPINIDTFKQYLVRMFITEKLSPAQLLLHKDVFLDALLSFPTPGPGGKPIKAFPKAVMGITTNRSVRQRAKALILKCFCARILEPDVDGIQLRVKLGYNNDGNPRLNAPGAWNGFKVLSPKK